MRGHRRGQQGAILVLTAFLLPFIIAFTGMAVDFGSAYVRRSQLQNAADAAVLAGAYHLDDDKADDVVLQYLKTNLDPHFTNYSYQTGDDFPDTFETLNYHTDKQKDELDVTLRSSVEASFLKLFDINMIPVSATAKAKVSTEESSDTTDDIFNYGLVAGKIPDYNYTYSGVDAAKPYSSILFDNKDIYVKGNIATNGRIAIDNYGVDTLDGKIYASYDVFRSRPYPPRYFDNGNIYKKYSPDVWGTIDWGDVNYDGRIISMESYIVFVDENGKSFTEPTVIHGTMQDVSRPDKVNYVQRFDISRDGNKGIDSLIRKYRDMGEADRLANHVYYNDTDDWTPYFWINNSGEYPGWTTSSDRWYRVIIAKGDINVGSNYPTEPSENEYGIIISLNGNINLHNDKTFHGIVYAPKGKVTIDRTGDVFGSIVADNITINSPMRITAKNYLKGISSGSSTSGKKKVNLIK